jgi:tetratricopeptide (TPR) repeat protein
MPKGRRKVGPPREGPPPVAAAPARVPEPAAPPAGKGRRLGLAAIVVVAVAGAALAAWKLWPRSVPLEEPAGLDRAVPEVRDHVRSRVQRAREDPKDAGRLTDLALALAANGFWRDARPVFEAVAKSAPGDPLPKLYAARAALETGDVATAGEELEDVVEEFPKFAPALYGLGALLLDQGDLEGATRRFTDLVSTEGNEGGWGQVGLANTLLKKGKPEQAATLLEPVVRARPSFPEANYLLGTAYRALKRLELANRHLSRGVRESDNGMPDAWSPRLVIEGRTVGRKIIYAQSLRDAGKLNEAITVLEAARTAHPDDLELLSNLGALYLDAQRDEAARAVLARAEKVNPRHLPTLYNLVTAEIRMKAYESALGYAGRAIDYAPSQRQGYVSRSEVLLAMNRTPEAVEAVREAVRLHPGDANLRFRLGVMLGRLDKFAEAKSELDVATQLDPANAPAWVLLAESCLRLGLPREARAALQEARRIAPNMEEIKGLDRRIRALEQS